MAKQPLNSSEPDAKDLEANYGLSPEAGEIHERAITGAKWNKELQVLDIGGSGLEKTWHEQVEATVERKRDYMPKEGAYQTGMDDWDQLSYTSYQTMEEMKIIHQTAQSVMANLKQIKSDIIIAEFGAAGSLKFQPYIDAGIKLGLKMKYMPLDINPKSLQRHARYVWNKYPKISVIPLWGDFDQGAKHFEEQSAVGSHLFLSCGSIIYNAPKHVRRDRMRAISAFMKGDDIIIIGQDAPPQTDNEKRKVFDHYEGDNNRRFMRNFMNHIVRVGGQQGNVDGIWTYRSGLDEDGTCYYTHMVAEEDTKLFSRDIKKEESFNLFNSWKVEFQTILQEHERCAQDTGISISITELLTSKQAGCAEGTMFQVILQRHRARIS